MEYYIETGLSGRKRYKLHEITPYNLPNLKNQPLNKDWIPFAIKIMDDLAVDFNSYKFFCDVLKNTPPRFRFFALNEAVLDLCKLLDERRNNKLALSNILMLQFSFCRIKTSSTGSQTALCAYTKRK